MRLKLPSKPTLTRPTPTLNPSSGPSPLMTSSPAFSASDKELLTDHFCNRVGQRPNGASHRGCLSSVRGRHQAATGYGQEGWAGQSSKRAQQMLARRLLRPHPASSPRRDFACRSGEKVLRATPRQSPGSSRTRCHRATSDATRRRACGRPPPWRGACPRVWRQPCPRP
jgi:hypothetical protein